MGKHTTVTVTTRIPTKIAQTSAKYVLLVFFLLIYVYVLTKAFQMNFRSKLTAAIHFPRTLRSVSLCMLLLKIQNINKENFGCLNCVFRVYSPDTLKAMTQTTAQYH